jgi:hypothetical protein
MLDFGTSSTVCAEAEAMGEALKLIGYGGIIPQAEAATGKRSAMRGLSEGPVAIARLRESTGN